MNVKDIFEQQINKQVECLHDVYQQMVQITENYTINIIQALQLKAQNGEQLPSTDAISAILDKLQLNLQ
ncbi:hypothetical protein SS50377_21035 [Spironucleus salmonicida]|uniref:Uncharacterized protein n=1 Tax=Spironucleus salmonicida TaxID=348837 RepID=A0A9P8M0B3_9EUKA|nr:hypothetical protein SS50377_21035 [Spironucleus salmonicida]